MNITVTGQFSAVKQATRAVDKLLGSCVSNDRVHTILLKPSPQRPAHNVASTCEKSSRSKSNHSAAAQPAPAWGGVLGKIGDDERRSSNRPAGILVAVETPNRVSQALAVNVFLEHGARIVESDAGRSPDNYWPDSDPVSLSALFDKFAAGNKQGPGFVSIEIERPSSLNTGRRADSGIRENSGRQQAAAGYSGQKDSFGKL